MYQEVVFLPSGNYEFKIIEADKNDNDSDNEPRVDINIL
jgi:hypothetical protein